MRFAGTIDPGGAEVSTNPLTILYIMVPLSAVLQDFRFSRLRLFTISEALDV